MKFPIHARVYGVFLSRPHLDTGGYKGIKSYYRHLEFRLYECF